MRLLKTILTAVVVVGLSAASANALVTVTHVSDAVGVQDQGAIFNVDIVTGYDGLDGNLQGIFTSASWDTSELALINVPTASNFAIFFGPSGFLSKIADPGVFPGDPAGTIRTIQYGAAPGQEGGAGADVVITTLQFQVIGGLDGVANIDVFLNSGDLIVGGTTSSFAGASVDYVPVPEPGTALLMGLGLAGLGLAGRRKA